MNEEPTRSAPAKKLWAALALALLGGVTFSGAIGHGFTFDDKYHVVSNEALSQPLDFGAVFQEPTWPGNLYRPVVTLSFLLTKRAFGDSPGPYHITNLALHALVCGMLFLVLARRFDTTLAALTTALFAVHPLHAEAVANVSNRTELLAALFGFLSLWTVLQREANVDSGVRRAAWSLLLFVSFLLATASKESAICLVGIVPFLLQDGTSWRGLGRGIRRSLPSLFVMSLSFACYLAMRVHTLGAVLTERSITFLDNPLADRVGVERILLALPLLGKYVSLSVLPWNLSPDYSFASLGSFERLDPALLGQGFALLVVLGLAAYPSRLSFWAIWFLVSFAVTANLLFPIGTVFAERLAYVPSVGIAGLMASAILTLRPRILRPVASVAVCAALLVASVQYTRDWESNERIFLRGIRAQPQSAKMHHNYGAMLLTKGDRAGATRHFERALSIYPEYPNPAFRLGRIALSEERLEDADRWLTRAQRGRPNRVEYLNTLARARFLRGDEASAERLLRRSLRIDPDPLSTKIGLLTVLVERGKLEEAAAFAAGLRRQHPGHPDLSRLIDRLESERAKTVPSPGPATPR
jgi:Tfp pilus assembly protein PilF